MCNWFCYVKLRYIGLFKILLNFGLVAVSDEEPLELDLWNVVRR